MFTGILEMASLAAAVASQGFLAQGKGAVDAYCDFHRIDREDPKAIARSLQAIRFCGRQDCITEDLMRLPNGRDIRWAVGPGWKIPKMYVVDTFAWAWFHWSEVCGISPRMVDRVEDANVVFEGREIDGAGKTLAISDWPDGNRQVWGRFDSTESWVFMNEPPKFKLDLGRVAMHEIGHLLGIPHLSAGALMQPMYDLKLRGLQPADIAEAVRRYGPGPGARGQQSGEGVSQKALVAEKGDQNMRGNMQDLPAMTASSDFVEVTIRVPVTSILVPGYVLKRVEG